MAVRVGTTHSSVQRKGRINGQIPRVTGLLGRTFAKGTTRNQRASLPVILRNQPRASSPTNDSYSIDRLQRGLLAGSQTLARQTIDTSVNFPVLKVVVHTAPGHSHPKERIKSRGSSLLLSSKKTEIKICERCFLCHSIVLCKTCNKCKKCCTKSTCRTRLQNYWQTWLDLGAGPKVVQILREGYTVPFRIQPKLTRSPTVISCYVNPHRNLYLLEALHQLIDKNAVELVQNKKSLGFSTDSF